ncbi:MAG: LysE family transporter, partial [Pseudomonadota bacterium]
CAMSEGRDPAVRFAFGLASGLSLWGLVAATGMGVILLASELALIGLKVVGALYLLWLALSSFRSAKAPENEPPKIKFSFTSGLVFNCLNPKAVVAWMAALSVGLTPDTGATQLLVATVSCALAALAINLTIAFGFSRTGMMAFYARCRRQIQMLSAGLFALAGGALLRSAIKS